MDIRKQIINDLEERINKISKLNEELTAENSRLLERIDVIVDWYDTAATLLNKSDEELSSIKSKWWYKLMTWLGW